MSTPSNTSNGPTPTGPNGAPPPPMRIRRPKNAGDPLVRPKRRPARPVGAAPGGATATKTLPARPSVPGTPSLAHTPKPRSAPVPDLRSVNGFSGPLLSQKYVDYPLVTTRKALREGLKYHVARFNSKRTIDPRDESQFTRPVRLHRRDPRARAHESHGEKMVGPDGQQLDEAEREALDARRAAREKERAENMAQIAPSVGSTTKRPNAPKQKTQQVFKSDMTKEEIARARLRYEEALPWHLEDFDNRNIWVGNYEAALSETHAVFVLENNKMRMIPAEKWYKFSAKQQFKALTIEEAEKYMSKRTKDPRWFMEKQKEIETKQQMDLFAKKQKVFAGKQGISGREGLEASEMDFEEDRFADDEEHADLFNDEQDEETKAAERRIKEDQLKANVFDLKEEKDYEEEEEREKKEREARRTFGKKVRKALKKRERNFDYSSGSDVNPYTDEESSDDSEVERQKEEEKRKAEEERLQREKDSATSTKGSNTPSGRPKHTDALKKPAQSRKRLGSPGSDASGTDTSRKKAKSKHPTSQPISRPMSPSAAQAGKKRIRNVPLGGSGSGSDVDVGAGSGGELSESGKTKKLRLNPPSATSRSGTPQGSRATSPVGGTQFPGSRAASPDGPRGAGRSTPVPSGQPFPTPAEIHAAIPATGITSSDLLKIFRPRIGESKENHRRFIAIVKDVGLYGKEDRMLRPGTWKPT